MHIYTYMYIHTHINIRTKSVPAPPVHAFCNPSLSQPVFMTVLQKVWISEKKITYNLIS